jgi:DNA-binding NtrC family response regulator
LNTAGGFTRHRVRAQSFAGSPAAGRRGRDPPVDHPTTGRQNIGGVPNLLLVDAESNVRSAVAQRLTYQGFDVTEADSGTRALELLPELAPSVLVADLQLPGIGGRRVIEAAIEHDPGIVVIAMTRAESVDEAIDALALGAADFVAKPFRFDELSHVLRAALERRRLASENTELRRQLDARFGLGAIVGVSPLMRDVFQLIETVAPTGTTVLVHGAPGTGKETVAHAIHQSSPRCHQRFVPVNCRAIPETLLEEELFGQADAAGTTAVQRGRLEQADRGTLFLDDVGMLPRTVQMKLLRVMQERELERGGGAVKVDVRLVAATSANLFQKVKDGTFREDLYYRLNVIKIDLPSLWDRKEDVPLLVQHFVAKYAGGGSSPMVSQEAMRRLMGFAWPGNVRQLENAIERAIAVLGGRSTIEVTDLPGEVQGGMRPFFPIVDFPEGGLDLPAMVEQIEREVIGKALAKAGGNKAKAAELLRMKRTTLVEKLKRIRD